jgi:hypothetical protein
MRLRLLLFLARYCVAAYCSAVQWGVQCVHTAVPVRRAPHCYR